VTTLLDNLSSELGGPLTEQQRQWVARADHRLRGALELLRGLAGSGGFSKPSLWRT